MVEFTSKAIWNLECALWKVFNYKFNYLNRPKAIKYLSEFWYFVSFKEFVYLT